MTELIAWSRDVSLGYLKHPPLAAWLVRLWFSIVPSTDLSFYLLAMLMPTIALWVVWRLSADYLELDKRVLGIALLTLVPFYNFHALKFNANTVLLPAWAATTLWFLRSYNTYSALHSVLTGIGMGICLLGKYWSVFLIAGLFSPHCSIPVARHISAQPRHGLRSLSALRCLLRTCFGFTSTILCPFNMHSKACR